MSPKKEKTFSHELSYFLSEFDFYKEKYFNSKKKEDSKLKVAGEFWKDIEDFMEGGKKLRGFLVYLGYLIGGGRDIKKILPVCLAYELTHSFLLIHDDVIDRSETRRGKVTIHKKYAKVHGDHFGESIAIVWGDIAAYEAITLLNNTGFKPDLKKHAIQFFANTIIATGYGETLDVLADYQRSKESDIRSINLLKTARYSVAGPLVLGAILAGSKKSQIEKLENFGLLAGEAFQLKDDLLGVFGDEKKIGKSILSDMQEGKNTLLVYKTREMATKSQRMEIDNLWGKGNATMADIHKVREIVEKSGAYWWYLNKMEKLRKQALFEVEKAPISPDLKHVIYEMCEYIIKREV